MVRPPLFGGCSGSSGPDLWRLLSPSRFAASTRLFRHIAAYPAFCYERTAERAPNFLFSLLHFVEGLVVIALCSTWNWFMVRICQPFLFAFSTMPKKLDGWYITACGKCSRPRLPEWCLPSQPVCCRSYSNPA